MTLKRSIFIVVLIITSFQVKAQSSMEALLAKYNTNSVPYISVEELRMLKFDKDSILIFDAREKEEYEVSHIKNAQFVGYNDFSVEKISQLFSNKSIPIVVYCSVGIRSENISKKLENAGYQNVKNLYGGIFEWKNSGFAVYDTQEKETEKVHTFSKHWSKWLKKGEKVY